ncbi:universal stress protein [Aurantiacibacter odishensis]|uniref:universal stress protein n=1 Tax=Aurantiacibacter odishensis TaxID=1155476 RepID=UPI000E75526F|nr:universal stress protein [Aurantiacibacter odishensis]
MRSILVHAMNDAGFDARLQVGLDLCRRFNGHLTVLQTITFDLVVPTDPFGVSAVEVSQASMKLAEEFREKIEGKLKQEDVRWDWHVEAGYQVQCLIRHAALNDLVLVGGAPDGSEGRRSFSIAGTLAIHCRTPIMAVPHTANGFPADTAAALCWNGSMEAARAMRAAVPLLASASAVHILCVGDPAEEGDEKLPAISAADYLERHDIDCEIVQLPLGKEPVHETLRKAAEAREAGFMVMGAYGQPRIVETLFGGVTRNVLAEPPMPVLMAH